MKRFALLPLLAVLCLSALVPAPAFAIGPTANAMHPKSPLRYWDMKYTFSTTASTTATVVGIVPPGGAKLKDVIVAQAAAGTGGTSWTATPKVNGVALCTTQGGFTLAAGANVSTNTPYAAVRWANPTGGTQPVIDATKVLQTGGQLVTIDITLVGTYSGAVTGTVILLWEPLW